MAWCYLNIFLTAMGHWKKTNTVYPVQQARNLARGNVSVNLMESKKRRNDCKAARTILLIGSSFLLCWVPYIVMSMREFQNIIVSAPIQTISTLLAFFSTVSNPCIYGFLNKIMRFEMFRILGCILTCSFQTGSHTIDIDEVLSTTNNNTLTSRLSSNGRLRPLVLKSMTNTSIDNTRGNVLQPIAENNEECHQMQAVHPSFSASFDKENCETNSSRDNPSRKIVVNGS